MTRHIAKLFIRSLTLAAAALFFHISVASAADATGDIQEQMKALLTGTTTAHFASQSGAREGSSRSPTSDPQESVKQLLLGTTGSRVEAIKHTEVAGASRETDAKQRPVAYSDVQTAVRQSLLGQHHASDAS